MSDRFDEYCRIVIGSNAANPVRLVSHDWHGEKVPWNQQQIRSGMEANGEWALEVAQDGEYEFQLRRWPVEVDKPIRASLPAGELVPGGFQYVPGKAISVTSARIKIGDYDKTVPVSEQDKGAVFKVRLKAGDTFLKTWFITDQQESLGAYYVYVRRIS